MKRITYITFLPFVVFSLLCNALALEKETHRYLNRKIIEENEEKFNTYLNSNLGFLDGVKQILNGLRVIEWFENAGRQEDEPAYTRSFNHFHDPLQPWDLAGFNKTFKSSLVWAQDQGMVGSLLGGDWSWKRARDSFFKGLTSLDKTSREKHFSDAFRALGQIMHLIQDASVPAHVRNDPHIYIDLFGRKIGKYHYESWVQDNLAKINLSPVSFDKSIFTFSPDPLAPIPIANLFDTNQYDGTNLGMTTGSMIGITEYTNANFFSEGTVFQNYPHPTYLDTNYFSIDWKNPEVIDGEDGKQDRRIYIKKLEGERLASLSYISYDCIQKGSDESCPLVLDEKVYEEYASKLIPRAVSYSAGLLDYFFRGKLQVTSIPIFYKNRLIYLRVKIKNLTPNEILRDGVFTLTYSFRPKDGNLDGSQDIWGQDSSPSGTLVEGKEVVIDFFLSVPIPRESYASAKFTLAFKGTLGEEVGAVIGKGLSLGEIKFEEEWDNGFTGNHHWAHTGITLLGQNPDNGATSNVIQDGYLIKENIRYAGYKSARVNESYVGYDVIGNQFLDILPISITPETYIQFKIDEMGINEKTPASPGYTNDWQYLMLTFNEGLGIQYSLDQFIYLGPKVVYLTFDPNLIIMDNLYNLFEKAGISIPPGGLILRNIAFVQQLSILDTNSTVEHRQRMKIDSLRLIEGKRQ